MNLEQPLSDTFIAATVAFLFSAALCWLIIQKFQHRLDRVKLHQDLSAVQAMHTRPTPRIGGAAIIGVFALVYAYFAQTMGSDLTLSLLAGGLVFVFGLWEDVYRNVSAKKRFVAAVISAAIAIALTSDTINHTGITQIDVIFSFAAVPVIITLIWSAGTCHSLNLIDGLNGLSSLYSIVALAALSMLAAQVGAWDIQMTCIILIGAICGFLIFNWPHGKLFLGDGGAYAIGHILAWIGIVLISRAPSITPLALLLILFWPVADTVFSMIRRLILGKSIAAPDRLHFHHIVVRLLMQQFKGRVAQDWVNPFTSLLLLPLFSAPALTSFYFWSQPVKAFVALLLFAILFLVCYILIIDLVASRRISRKKVNRG